MMTANGYAKLIEELGELLQVLGKRLAYYHTDAHPDGGKPITERLEDELGDVLGACSFAIEANDLNNENILARAERKLHVFRTWHERTDNNEFAIDGREKRLRAAFLMCRQMLANHTGTWSNAATFGLQPEDIGLKREQE